MIPCDPDPHIPWSSLRYLPQHISPSNCLSTLPPLYSQCFRTHFAKLGMRSLATPAQPPPFKPGIIMTLQGMMNEALNGAYAKIESVVANKEKKKEREIRVSLCGNHLDCDGVAISLMEECVICLDAQAFSCSVRSCCC